MPGEGGRTTPNGEGKPWGNRGLPHIDAAVFCNGIPLHEDTRESLGQIDKRIAFHRRIQAAPNLGSQTCIHYKS